MKFKQPDKDDWQTVALQLENIILDYRDEAERLHRTVEDVERTVSALAQEIIWLRQQLKGAVVRLKDRDKIFRFCDEKKIFLPLDKS